MARPDLTRLAVAERRDLADFLDTLDAADWERPSLCEGWSVREVVAHVVSYEELGALGLVRRFAKGALVRSPNAVGVREYAGRSPAELVAFLRAHLHPRGLTAGFGGAIALTDGLIHHQDVRRALGRLRVVPPERVRPALDQALVAPTLPSRRKVRGLRLVASDTDWSHGSGAEVRGTGEALLMAVAGRPDALSDLSGPGAATLARRLRS